MIKIQDWIASIPDEDKHVAYVGEGKSEQREFLLCGKGWEDYQSYNFHLDMAFDPTSITTRDSRQVVQTTVNSTEHIDDTTVTADEVTTKETYTVENVSQTAHSLSDIAPLSKTVTADGIRLTWNILRQHTILPGKLWATVRAVSEDSQRIKKSAIMVFEVDPAICAIPAVVPPISEFEQMTTQMDDLRRQTEAAADTASRQVQLAVSAADAARAAANTAEEHTATAAANAEQTNEHRNAAASYAASAALSAQGAQQHADTALTAAKQSAASAAEATTMVEEQVLPRLEALEQNGTNAPVKSDSVSVTNLVINPQFRDADWTAKWDFLSPTIEDDEGAVKLEDEGLCLSLHGADKVNFVLRQRLTKSLFTVGNRYYMYARVKYDGRVPINGEGVGIGFNGITVSDVVVRRPIGSTEWDYVSSVSTLPAMPSGSLGVVVSSNYTGTKDLTVLYDTTIHYNNVMVIDLTAAFGAGNEPSIATMDQLIGTLYPNGFEGQVLLPTSQDLIAVLGRVQAVEEALAVKATVYPSLDEHYIQNIRKAKPIYYENQGANTLSFAMMADMHLTPTGISTLKNVEASSVWSKLVNHDFIMMAGDFFTGRNEDKSTSLELLDTLVEMAEKHASCPVYAVKGNHDTCEDTGNKADRITDEEFYRHANARGEKHGMVTDPAHPYAGYYYVDFPHQKIRMVCLNTSELIANVDLSTSSNGDFRHIGVFSSNQLAWLTNTALRVDEGWAVMMVSHIAPFQAENFANRGTDNPALRQLCEDFAAGTGVFADQQAREFIGHFCGHCHTDSYNKVGGLNYVTVNSTVPTKQYDVSLHRNPNGDTALSLNAFIIRRDTVHGGGTVACIKVGAAPGEDYAGNWVDAFTW